MPLFYPQVTHVIGGNTDGATANISSGVMTLAGGDNITLSQNGNAVTISGAAGGPGGGNQSIGISNAGNTAGTSGLATGAVVRYVIAGTNNVTMSQSLNGASATLTVIGPNLLSAGVSTGGNTAGTTGVVSNQLVMVGSNGISLSQSANAGSATVTINGFQKSVYRYDAIIANATSTNTSNAVQSWFYMHVPYFIDATKLDFAASLSANTNSTGQYTISLGLYTISGSTASLASSVSVSRSWTSGTAGGATASSAYGGVSNFHTRTAAIGTWAITPGEYLVGFWMRTTGGAQTWAPNFFFGNIPTNLHDTNETQNWDHGYSTASYSTAMIGSINLTDTNYVRSSNLNRGLAMRFFASNS